MRTAEPVLDEGYRNEEPAFISGTALEIEGILDSKEQATLQA